MIECGMKIILSIVITISLAVSTTDSIAEDRMLVSFDKAGTAAAWRTVNDGVMGGRSSGRAKVNSEKNLEFFGDLSLENNGGFASVRGKTPRVDLKSSETIVLRIKGDGREYNFNLYTQADLGGYAYRMAFKTVRNKWVEVRMPVNKFVATWRGRVYPNERLDPGRVAGMGILLGDKRPGSFSLQVDWIKASPAVKLKTK